MKRKEGEEGKGKPIERSFNYEKKIKGKNEKKKRK